jgi:hypothetical protein
MLLHIFTSPFCSQRDNQLLQCREAFTFLFEEGAASKPAPPLFQKLFGGLAKRGRVLREFPDRDMRGLRGLESSLQKSKVINQDEG